MSEATSVSTSQFFTTAMQPAAEDASTSSSYMHKIVKDLKKDDIRRFFEVEATVAWILANGYQRVGLQFPDPFLQCAFDVAQLIEAEANCKAYVLADTTYRSCCVDDVTAAHAGCDALVHYGDACLSVPTKIVAVRFVLGQLPVDSDQFKMALEANSQAIQSDFVLFLIDSMYAHLTAELLAQVRITLDRCRVECANVLQPDDFSEESRDKIRLGRRLPVGFNEAPAVEVVFVGAQDSPLLPLWLMTFTNCTSVLHFDPADNSSQHEQTKSARQLRKRLFLVEKLKDANTVGLIVSGLGVHGNREAVQRMRELCKAASKKIYVISVGKVNVPKLSNFAADIDVFVLLSCPFGVVLDASDFFKPVVSFFEAEMALNPAKTWAAVGGWTAEFGGFLSDAIGEQVDEEADMSLVSGRVRVARKETAADEDQGGAVQLYTAGDYFAQRSWKGLDDAIRPNEDVQLREGRSGIAQSYQGK